MKIKPQQRQMSMREKESTLMTFGTSLDFILSIVWIRVNFLATDNAKITTWEIYKGS